MNFKNLLYQPENGILTITINRPDKLNALNQETLKELQIAFETAKKENFKGIILTGSGEKAFVAGADISEFQGLSIEQAKKLSANGHDLYNFIENFPIPVIAAVNGFALGGGCELAMACHMRIGTERAKFGQPEVNLGIIAGYGGTQRLIQYIGKGRSLELHMTADTIDAQTAWSYGLLNHIVEHDDLMPKCHAIIEKIATKGPIAITKVIECTNAYFKEGVDGFQYEIHAFSSLFNTEDVIEGSKAFLEKRKPEFKGK